MGAAAVAEGWGCLRRVGFLSLPIVGAAAVAEGKGGVLPAIKHFPKEVVYH